MLQLLHIENIAVIERADISFRAGFNALTGETGAGKSIVIDSLGAVLGARTSRDLIRTGAAKAFVSAEFDGVDASLPVLAALGVEPEDGVLLLQRDIYADGKNICRANGRPITVAQLRALGTSLLNIHGQHEGTQLLDEEQHGAYLDRFARLDGLPEAYTERYQAARETRRQIEALEMDEAEKARRVDTLRHQIAELERAELRDGEEEELLARRELLRNAEYLKQKRINEATEQVAMFEAMYKEYSQNPGITRSRMYYEAISEALPDVKVYIDTSGENGVQKVLPLESFTQGDMTTTAPEKGEE